MVRDKTVRFALWLPGDIYVHLKELALAGKVKMSAYIIGVLREHCKTAPRVRVEREGRPSPAQYVDYNRKLEMHFMAVEGRIPGVAKSRGRTQFDKWVSYTAGEANPVRRTVEQWDKVFKKAETYGDIFHERSQATYPNDAFALDIKKTADMVDFLKGDDEE